MVEGIGRAVATEGALFYMSNADRADMVLAMKEWIAREEAKHGR